MAEKLKLSKLDRTRPKHFGFGTDSISNKSEPDLSIRLDTGTRLAEARRKLDLTQSDISHQIKLSEDLIDAIEFCRYDKLFGKAYATGYVRAYASVVQLDPDELIENDPQLGVEAITNIETANYPSSSNKTHYTTTWSTIATRIIVIGLILLLAVAGWNFRDEFMAWWDGQVQDSQVQQQNILEIQESPTDEQQKTNPAEPSGIDNIQTPS